MQWPFLAETNSVVQTQDAFGGYHHADRIGEGEFYDMENMTSDHFPVLSPRSPRGTFLRSGNVQGMIHKDALCYVDGSCFVINGMPVEMHLSEDPEDCPKQLISMGAYVIILPDKKYINTADPEDRGNMDARFTTQAPVTFSLCMADGSDCVPNHCQPGEPVEPENMALWMDTSVFPGTLKQWSASGGMWVTVTGTYVKIASPGIGKAFSIHDGVFLKGLSGALKDSASGEVIADSRDLAALEGTAVIWAKADDYLVVTGILERSRTVSNPVTVSREMPLMDFVTERENRLWGCRYGPDRNGRVVNEIYASKLGDFKNWNCFMGISTDSYAVSVGSDGPFTGAVTYGGYPLFWKENCVHKVFGSYPANFGIQTTACRGVRQGSSRSLSIVNELLYYKARHHVCCFDGSLPVEISQNLGDLRYTDAVACGHGNKYYISLRRESDARSELLVYDTARNLWHREDTLPVKLLCSCADVLYCTTENGEIRILQGAKEPDEGKVSWMVETGLLGMTFPEVKCLKKLQIRMALEAGSSAVVQAEYDSCGRWTTVATLQGTDLRSFCFWVKPRRCDHFRLRIRGLGQAKLLSFTKSFSRGSDRT